MWTVGKLDNRSDGGGPGDLEGIFRSEYQHVKEIIDYSNTKDVRKSI